MSIFFSYFNLLYIELYSCQISLENNNFFCEVTVGILAPPLSPLILKNAQS